MAESDTVNDDFWRGRRVLLTGHSGFKGAWVGALLADQGAEVTGLSLAPESGHNLWSMLRGRIPIADNVVDLRNAVEVAEICRKANPEIVLHMAAQAQVRRSYDDPAETFESNILGTVNLLEALRAQRGLQAVLVVTSDKVYLNDNSGTPFIETSPLGGSDPYSASKSAVEIVVRSYADCYFSQKGVPLATARGGNVIGGGDFSSDRLVPDLFRAAQSKRPAELRYPDADRPWQHVLDCVNGYLMFLEHLAGKKSGHPHALNFGPLERNHFSVAEIASTLSTRLGNPTAWVKAQGEFPAEKLALRLDSTLATKILGWRPLLDTLKTIDWTAEWYAAFANGGNPLELVRSQTARFAKL